MSNPTERQVVIPVGSVGLAGDLVIPPEARGLVLFAHGSGSSRHSPRNRFVAGQLQASGIATLLMDLLTTKEEREEEFTGHLRFDIDLLANRLVAATDWGHSQAATRGLRIGYFGASTGAGAALVAAAHCSDVIAAVVSRGGRPDLAGDALSRVLVPALLIVGGEDDVVIELNRQAMRQLRGEVRLEIIPGATHLFKEPGTLERVAELAGEFFQEHLAPLPPGQAAFEQPSPYPA